MANNIAGNATDMDALSKDFTDAAGQVLDLHNRLGRIVNEMVGTKWQGSAADNFRGAWDEQFSGGLTTLEQALGHAAKEVQNRKLALIEADS